MPILGQFAEEVYPETALLQQVKGVGSRAAAFRQRKDCSGSVLSHRSSHGRNASRDLRAGMHCRKHPLDL